MSKRDRAPVLELTAETLRLAFRYDAETGHLIWLIHPPRSRIEPGTIAGSVYKNGYRYIEFDGARYRAHRLVWLYVYGVWPPDYIDHENGTKDDNRIENLRECDNSRNQANRGAPRNNTSGFKGVSWDAVSNGWRAAITIRGVAKCIGVSKTKEMAAMAYAEMAERGFGEFKRTS